MTTFKINRNSWHYWLNKNFFNESYGMQGWEAKHSNFCAYWRATFFRVLFAMLLFSVASLIVVMLGVFIFTEPVAAGYTGLAILALIAAFVAIVVGSEYFEEYKEKNPEPKTLIGKQYAAYKGKFCPSVEFGE